MVVLLAIIGAIVAIVVVVAFINRFYRKSSRETALIRTGAGGQRVILDGGVLALPFLHRVEEINMRTHRMEVQRTGDRSLITEDRMRVDVALEFYVRVQPSPEGVATAAQAFGSRALRSEELRDLIEGRFVDALQAVAAAQSMDSLHEKRAAFVKSVRDAIQEEMEHNGLQLESVSLTRLDQTPFGALNENNAFNAVGMRRLAEIVATNKKKRAQIESDAELSVRQTQLDAMKRKLEIEKEQEQAQIGQRLELERSRSESDAAIAKAKEQATLTTAQSKIDREREIKSSEIQRERELRMREMESLLATEVARVENAIVLAGKQTDEAAATAKAELAKAQIILAQEKVQTDRERALSVRARELAKLRSEQDEEVESIRTRIEVESLVQKAKAEAEATRIKAEAEREQMLAESAGRKALIAAENSYSEAVLRTNLERHKVDKLPELAAQMMKPVEKIDSIRINHISGLNGSQGSGGAAGGTVNQAVESILGMALQYPVIKKLGESIGVDLDGVISPTGDDNAQNETKR